MGKIRPVVAEIFYFWYLRSSSIESCLHLNNFYRLVCSNKLKFKIWGRSDQRFLRYFIFDIWGHLPLEVFFIWIIFIVWFGYISLSLEFGEDPASGCWDRSLLIFYRLVCSNKIKFKIWGRSDQWFLRYFIFDIWGHLPLEVFFIWIIFIVWFGYISLSLEFGEDPASGCWDRSLLIFEVVFQF